MNLLSLLGIALVLFVAFRFIKGLGKRLPILEMMVLVAGLQWIIGPAIEYQATSHHYKYYMYVEEAVYMAYVVPAYGVFTLIILYGLKRVPKLNLDITKFNEFATYGKYILLVGVFFDFAGSSAPGGLKFVFFLLSNFKYAGALILLFSIRKWDRYLFYAALAYLFFGAIRSGFFHDLLLWGTFFYMFWAYKVKPSIKLNIIIIGIGMFGATLIQGVKANYRAIISEGYEGSYVSLFFDSVGQRLTRDEETLGFEDNDELNVRLNQGWIISAIMEHTPRMQPYADGATVMEAVFASALPRFLNPDKKIAGGVENFEKFTGLPLGENTSMGMSIIGEAYANFGVGGGILFMAIWGFVLIRFWFFILRQVGNRPLLIFFIPLMFLQVIKAETELVVVLNHLVKSLILIFVFFWLSRKFIYKNFGNEDDNLFCNAQETSEL